MRIAGALVATNLGNTPLEAHSLGFGNLQRYVAEVQPARDELVVEDYWIVLPLQMEAGPHLLTVTLQDPLQPGEPMLEDTITLQDVVLEGEAE